MTQPPFLLLDNAPADASAQNAALLFQQPERIIQCWHPEEVDSALDALDAGLKDGLYAAGFFSYELGYCLEPKLRPLLPTQRRQPLCWFMLCQAPYPLSRQARVDWLQQQAGETAKLENNGLSQTRDDYLQAVARVKDYIAAGDIYQVNLTLRQRCQLNGDPLALYQQLDGKQPVSHGGYLDNGECQLLSLSPELFMTAHQGQARLKPMKGTAARHANPQRDAEQRQALQRDTKNRAENLMILDLMRNDLGRLALPGSVQVPRLFEVESYPTLHQMTSTVTGQLPANLSAKQLLTTLFPCGSITGAPKIRAMEIIRELETDARGAYTGSLGYFAPNGDISLNVAIRTLFVDNKGQGELGIGSGIVADSDAAAEYDECLLKGQFLTQLFDTEAELIQ